MPNGRVTITAKWPRLSEGLTNLSEEEQIIAISDVYVALVEDPYRKGMSHQEAMYILKIWLIVEILITDFLANLTLLLLKNCLAKTQEN